MDKRVPAIFNTLFTAFGPQGWWPTTPEGSPSPVYNPQNHSRTLSDKERTEIMIGAILTQNTAWKNVEKALAHLHAAELIDFARLVAVRQPALAGKIRSAGYFNQKSKRLKLFAAYMIKKYDGDSGLLASKSRSILDLRAELLALNGVGPETADSMILYALSRPIFVVDAYTRRIFSRVGLIDEKASYDDIQRLVHEAIAGNDSERTRDFNEFHALLVELAKRNCRKRPECGNCPVRPGCATGKGELHR